MIIIRRIPTSIFLFVIFLLMQNKDLVGQKTQFRAYLYSQWNTTVVDTIFSDIDMDHFNIDTLFPEWLVNGLYIIHLTHDIEYNYEIDSIPENCLSRGMFCTSDPFELIFDKEPLPNGNWYYTELSNDSIRYYWQKTIRNGCFDRFAIEYENNLPRFLLNFSDCQLDGLMVSYDEYNGNWIRIYANGTEVKNWKMPPYKGFEE